MRHIIAAFLLLSPVVFVAPAVADDARSSDPAMDGADPLALSPLPCTCETEYDLEEAFERATIIAVGQVLAIKTNPLRPDEREIRLGIVRSFKGAEEARPVMLVYTPKSPCGFPFGINAKYLVYASGGVAHLTTSKCDRTAPAGERELEIQKLIRLAAPIGGAAAGK